MNKGRAIAAPSQDISGLGIGTLLAEADWPDTCEAGQFVASGLRAARTARTPARPAILSDIARVLGCRADELEFLFGERYAPANDADPISMPDFRAVLRGEDRLLVAE